MIDLVVIAILVVAAAAAAMLFDSPTPTLALIVTACGILLTWRTARAQKQLAERKLFLDLMPRRAEWYDRVRTALEHRAAERVRQVEMILQGQHPENPEQLMKLYQLETEAGWLFDDQMLALIAAMLLADKQLNERQLAAREGDTQAALGIGELQSALHAAQGRLQDRLVGYLYVGDIGKPKRSSVTFAKTRRRGPFGRVRK